MRSGTDVDRWGRYGVVMAMEEKRQVTFDDQNDADAQAFYRARESGAPLFWEGECWTVENRSKLDPERNRGVTFFLIRRDPGDCEQAG